MEMDAGCISERRHRSMTYVHLTGERWIRQYHNNDRVSWIRDRDVVVADWGEAHEAWATLSRDAACVWSVKTDICVHNTCHQDIDISVLSATRLSIYTQLYQPVENIMHLPSLRITTGLPPSGITHRRQRRPDEPIADTCLPCLASKQAQSPTACGFSCLKHLLTIR
jgi:hypothetical protein